MHDGVGVSHAICLMKGVNIYAKNVKCNGC